MITRETTMHRVVVRTPNWLGDAVMALPAIVAIRRHFAAAELAVAAPAGVGPVVEAAPDAAVNAVLTLPGGGALSGWRREARVLAAGGHDLAILLPNSFQTALAARAAGIPERWGYRRDMRRLLLTRAVRPPARRRDAAGHQAAYYQRLVEALGITPIDEPPRLAVRPEARRRAAALLAAEGASLSGPPLVGFAPGAAFGHAKRWPPARVAEVITRLGAEAGATCVLVGAADDREAGREVMAHLPVPPAYVTGTAAARVVNLIGRTDLPALLGVLSLCRVFVSNDSGAMHVAAALGLPVVALFGPTDERATAPAGAHDILTAPAWCRPCHLRDCPIDHRCMKRIGADLVADAVLRRIA
jgi:heptosyltransferase II